MCFVMIGTTFGAIVGAIVGVTLHKHYSTDQLIKAGCILAGAWYSGLLCAIVITHFLTGYGGFWGSVPAMLFSVPTWYLVLKPMEKEYGRWAALAVTAAAAVGSLSASWSHTPVFTLLFLTYAGILIGVSDHHGFINNDSKNKK